MFCSSSGSVLVCPMTGMKFWSPSQRGTTCWCRCAAIPAPATAPWFIPMLKPCTAETLRSVCIACLVSTLISSASSAVVSV